MNLRFLKTLLLSVIFIVFITLKSNAQFNPIGPGNYSNSSYVILVDGSDVYADGFFINGSDMFTYGKFNGTSWNKLGNWGLVMGLRKSSIKIGDDIYIGGIFSDATGNADMDNIVRYNIPSNTWYPLGNGLNGSVMSIIQMGTDIIAVGNFTNAGGDANADFIAKWNGTSWSALSNQVVSTNSSTYVNAVIIYNNELYIGGNFSNTLLKFDGTNFINVSGWNSSSGAVYEFAVDGNNNLYVACESGEIYKYNGTTWSALNFTGDTPPGSYFLVHAMVANGSDLYVGGSFLNAKGIAAADYLIKYDGNTTWSAVGGGLNDNVNDMTISGGELYIAGGFTDAGGNTAADKLIKINLAVSTQITENNNDNKIKIYPNPNSGQFTIQKDKESVFELMDITGRVINTYRVKGRLDVSENLPAGMYFVRNRENGISQKLIIKK